MCQFLHFPQMANTRFFRSITFFRHRSRVARRRNSFGEDSAAANGTANELVLDETFPGEFPQHFKNPLKKYTLVLFFWGRWPTFLRWGFPWHSWNSDSERCGQITCSPSLRNQCLLYIFEYNFLMSTTTNCISPYTFSRLLNWFLLCENIGNDPMYQWYELCTHVAVPVQSSEDCHGIVADGSLTRNHWLSSCHPRSFKCCA